MAGHLIDSTEMYLRTVLELEEEGIPSLRARLAERLGLSAPSVSEGVNRLVDEGLLRLGDDRAVTLTEHGRELAVHVMRKHRLAERLLADVIGLESEYIHEEACRWEHVISDRVEEKLIEFLGDPDLSPYGNPIHGAGQTDTELVPLTEVADGRVRVTRISELLQQDREVMALFDQKGLRAGAEVDITRRADRVLLVAAGGDLELDAEDAKLVYVAAV